MSQINDSSVQNPATVQSTDEKQTFANENSWMVQCLSLAALGLVTYQYLGILMT